MVQVSAGVGWLVAWAVVDGLHLLSGAYPAPFGAWTGAVAMAGVGQVLAGSLAYLLPVLAGPPLGENSDRMTGRPWIPLVAANLTGVALVAGYAAVAVGSSAFWVLDFAHRFVSLRRGPLIPPD